MFYKMMLRSSVNLLSKKDNDNLCHSLKGQNISQNCPNWRSNNIDLPRTFGASYLTGRPCADYSDTIYSSMLEVHDD